MDANRVTVPGSPRDMVVRGMIALAIALAAPAADAGEVTRVSVTSAGSQANATSVSAGNRALTADARFVAFQSTASDLVAGDTNGVEDIFVHDRVTGATSRVSLATGGTQAMRASMNPAISHDGRFVAFDNVGALVGGDTNAASDVYVRDLVLGTTTRESIAATGGQGSRGSLAPALSADGLLLAFESGATNLVTGDSNGRRDVFVRDRANATTLRVSVGAGGTQGDADSSGAAIAAAAPVVAFESLATNLVSGDTNSVADVFVHDMAVGVTTRVSVASDGTQANGRSGRAVTSADGSLVAFESVASNLVADDSNGASDVFVHDRAAGTTTRVSVGAGGAQGSGGSFRPALSMDGRFVLFESAAPDLVPGDTNGTRDVFLHDRATGVTRRMGRGSEQPFGMSFGGALSPDGHAVVFDSLDVNLVAGDSNNSRDVFVQTPACGDGMGDVDEACDDGNPASGDGCDANCTPTGCGNGVTTDGEDCDDGNLADGDACPSDCVIRICGDGRLRDPEDCDDGNLVDGDGCDANCTVTGCGNGVVTAGEDCDDGNQVDDDACPNDCVLLRCGDGVVRAPEACDDGNLADGDGCDSNCTPTACGNTIVTPGEGCDDGNLADGDGCDANCTPTGCGNGILTTGEACDDGNGVSGDGCDVNCTPTGCGNTITTDAEECDDGNAVDGDGCEAGCRLTVCTGGVPIEKPVIRIFNLGPPFGDEHIMFSGMLRVDRDSLEPHQDGLQVLIEEGWPGGARLLALTHATNPIPPGGPGSGCSRGDGWKTNWSENRFLYRTSSGALDPPTCTPRSAAGLDFVAMHVHGRRGNRPIAFDVVALRTQVTRPIGALRAMLVLGAGAEAGMAGRCARHDFSGLACDYDTGRRTLTCK